MHEFIGWVKGVFGAIGAENVGLFIVFTAGTAAAIWRGHKGAHGAPVKEALTTRLDRIEREQEHMEERQMLDGGRISRVEGELGVIKQIVQANLTGS
jgi:hypothetical protein